MRYFFLLFISITSFAQNFEEYIEHQFDKIYDCNQCDSDSLAKEIQKYIVVQLEKEEIYVSEEESYYFKKQSAKDGFFHIYTFSYSSHGTRGMIDIPIIQWKKSDGTYGVYELGLETSFYKIYKLPAKNKNLYLLIGGQKGSSLLYVGTALVIEIKNDHLILDYPAFYDSSSLDFVDYIDSGESDCIACIEFSPENNTISILNLGSEDSVGPMRNPSNLPDGTGRIKEIFYVFDGIKFVEQPSSK